jgi:hypothetical protein
VGVVNLVVVGINLSNLLAYRFDPGLGFGVLQGVWAGTILVWFVVQGYAYPLFFEMAQPNILGAFRNAVVMVLRNLLFTLGLWTGIAAIAAISTVLIAAWGVVTGGVIAAITVGAIYDRLAVAGLRTPLPAPFTAPDAIDTDITG